MPLPTSSKEMLTRREIGILISIILGALALRLMLFIGYQGFDDRTYIAYARLFATGGDIVASGLRDQWIGRSGAWLPLSLFMKMFGGAQWVLSLYSLLCSLGGVVLAFLLGRKLFSPRHGLLAAFLLALLPLDVFYATRVHGDEAVGFWCAVALTAYLIAEYQLAPRRYLSYLLAGLAVGIAYLVKEFAVILALPMALLMLYRRKLEWRTLSLLAAGFFAVIAFELLFWSVAAGDPLYRWHTALGTRDIIVTPKTYNSLADWIPGPKPTEVYRSKNSILEAILMFTTNEEFGFLYYIVWPLSVWALWRGKREAASLAVFIVPTALVLLFFPFIFPTYTLARDPRYYTMLSVPAMVLIAWWSLRVRPAIRWTILGTLILTWVPCLYLGYAASGMGLQRELAKFAQLHPAERLWLSNRDAADVIILSGFDPALNLGITYLPLSAPQQSRLRSSPIAAMRPDLPVARTADDIRDGFVALPAPLRPQPPPGWRQTESLTDPPGALTRSVQRALLACNAPRDLVNNLVPSHGASIVIYRVTRQTGL